MRWWGALLAGVLVISFANGDQNCFEPASFLVTGSADYLLVNQSLPNQDCSFLFTSANGTFLSLENIEIRMVQPSSDYIAIYDGNTTAATLLARFYGGSTFLWTYSTQRHLLMTFHTDSTPASQRTLFPLGVIKVRVTEISEARRLCNGVVDVYVDGGCTDTTSVRNPYNYNGYISPGPACGWRVHTSPGYVIEALTSLQPYSLAPGDVINLYDGNSTSARLIETWVSLATLSEDHAKSSTGNVMYIEFARNSGDAAANYGFLIDLAVNPSPFCTGDVVEIDLTGANITTYKLDYLNALGYSPVGVTCKWHVFTDVGTRFNLNYPDFPSYPVNIDDRYQSLGHHLTVYNGASASAPRFQFINLPPLLSECNELFITYAPSIPDALGFSLSISPKLCFHTVCGGNKTISGLSPGTSTTLILTSFAGPQACSWTLLAAPSTDLYLYYSLEHHPARDQLLLVSNRTVMGSFPPTPTTQHYYRVANYSQLSFSTPGNGCGEQETDAYITIYAVVKPPVDEAMSNFSAPGTAFMPSNFNDQIALVFYDTTPSTRGWLIDSGEGNLVTMMLTLVFINPNHKITIYDGSNTGAPVLLTVANGKGNGNGIDGSGQYYVLSTGRTMLVFFDMRNDTSGPTGRGFYMIWTFEVAGYTTCAPYTTYHGYTITFGPNYLADTSNTTRPRPHQNCTLVYQIPDGWTGATFFGVQSSYTGNGVLFSEDRLTVYAGNGTTGDVVIVCGALGCNNFMNTITYFGTVFTIVATTGTVVTPMPALILIQATIGNIIRGVVIRLLKLS